MEILKPLQRSGLILQCTSHNDIIGSGEGQHFWELKRSIEWTKFEKSLETRIQAPQEHKKLDSTSTHQRLFMRKAETWHFLPELDTCQRLVVESLKYNVKICYNGLPFTPFWKRNHVPQPEAKKNHPTPWPWVTIRRVLEPFLLEHTVNTNVLRFLHQIPPTATPSEP